MTFFKDNIANTPVVKWVNAFSKKFARPLLFACAFIFIFSAVSVISFQDTKPAQANHKCCTCGPTCEKWIKNCAKSACECQSNQDTPVTVSHITEEFIKHREWLIKIVWEAHVLPAMMLMTEQVTTVAMQQMLIVGTFFDAKHQLETQRLLQEMQAQAHKDYQPSIGMCQFGTTTRSLAASDRNADLTQIGLAARSTQRQLLGGDAISSGGSTSDSGTRLAQFKKTYCNPADFGNGLTRLCDGSTPERYNRDVDFKGLIDSAYTLEIDLSKPEATADEEDVLALSANLYGSQIMRRIPEDKMADKDGNFVDLGAFAYMDTRALAAKRSVAQAAFAAQAAMRAQGEEGVMPYMEAILKEMGIAEPEVKKIVGERPSYHAQMELLTKKLYQTPNFYTELYDKPTNIDRKNVSMQAIGLMQLRDTYRSQLRSEAISAVLLETYLEDLQDKSLNEGIPLQAGTQIVKIPGLNK